MPYNSEETVHEIVSKITRELKAWETKLEECAKRGDATGVALLLHEKAYFDHADLRGSPLMKYDQLLQAGNRLLEQQRLEAGLERPQRRTREEAPINGIEQRVVIQDKAVDSVQKLIPSMRESSFYVYCKRFLLENVKLAGTEVPHYMRNALVAGFPDRYGPGKKRDAVKISDGEVSDIFHKDVAAAVKFIRRYDQKYNPDKKQ